jgi:hypothetical protein
MGLAVLTGERTQHRYQGCQDEDCQRYACRVWREGYDEGHAAAASEAEAAAAAGYADGYAAGAASGSG